MSLKNEKLNLQLTTVEAEKITKKTYQTPTVKQYGTLGELVQHQPGNGVDGDFFPDCSHS
jgi:hypothetical protein